MASGDARRIHAGIPGVILQVDPAARVHAAYFASVDEGPYLVLQLRYPVEIMLPIEAGNAGVRQDLRVSLLDPPIVGERIELMARLRRSVVVGA